MVAPAARSSPTPGAAAARRSASSMVTETHARQTRSSSCPARGATTDVGCVWRAPRRHRCIPAEAPSSAATPKCLPENLATTPVAFPAERAHSGFLETAGGSEDARRSARRPNNTARYHVKDEPSSPPARTALQQPRRTDPSSSSPPPSSCPSGGSSTVSRGVIVTVVC